MDAPFWCLDPDVTHLNHGSFGACPRPVLSAQDGIRARMERDPEIFFRRLYPELLDAARRRLAGFLGASPRDLVFVPNATTGVSAVLASAPLAPGDRVLTTDHAYPACREALFHLASRRGFEPDVVSIPLPIRHPDDVVARVLEGVRPRTRLALLSHVTSPTALVFPIERLVAELQGRGIDVLVDGAHSAGQVEVKLEALGAAYFTGNAHKWLCAPKGAAFLVVRPDRRAHVEPPVHSHFTRAPDRFPRAFDWMGTFDPSAILSIPAALDTLEDRFGPGLETLRARNHALVRRARTILLDALGGEAPAPAEMLGSMATVPLPDAPGGEAPEGTEATPLERALEDGGFRVPVIAWPRPPRRWLRVSAQAYNTERQYVRLADRLRAALTPP